MPLSRSIVALALSCVVHVVFVLAGARFAVAAHAPEEATQATDTADPWTGDTFEIGESVAAAGADRQDRQETVPTGQPQDPKAIAVTTAAPAQERARKPARPKPAASARTSSLQGNGAGSAGPGGSGGSFGMSGPAPGGPRDLGRAFTRAIPIAISPDPLWASMPPGPAGSFDLRIELGEDGRIASARPVGPVSDAMRAIGTRTVGLLGAGTFAIRAEPGAGAQVLRISATVSMAAAAPPNDASQAGAYGLGFEAPQNDKPGRAWFTLRSGKHVEVTVRVMKAQ